MSHMAWSADYDIYQIRNNKFVWVKGHDGNQYNELCDALAVNAYSQEELEIDKVYEDAN